MSAFLGPIHYWLYNKIQLQEEFIQDIVETAKNQGWDLALEEELAAACGTAERSPLEDVIDGGNIHGWLQYQIGISEARLAYAVTNLLKENEDRISILEKTAFAFGQKHSFDSEIKADEALKTLGDQLLDGMPCDHVNESIEQSKEKAVWRQTQCVHQEYWNEVNGDIRVYYQLRTQIIKGMLSTSSLTFEAQENEIFQIKQEG